MTNRYQTTVPETVRGGLRVGKRDKIDTTIGYSGAVGLTRSSLRGATTLYLEIFWAFWIRTLPTILSA